MSYVINTDRMKNKSTGERKLEVHTVKLRKPRRTPQVANSNRSSPQTRDVSVAPHCRAGGGRAWL